LVPHRYIAPLILVDLSDLRYVRVDAEKRLAYAQGGALWTDFNNATTAEGFVSVGGTVDHTGIGGLILGGGYGYLTGQYGLAIDNLVEVTIVVADGRILKANKNENADLFWGVRGISPATAAHRCRRGM
jgi:FAD/FMN-containing dehydrogenase